MEQLYCGCQICQPTRAVSPYNNYALQLPRRHSNKKIETYCLELPSGIPSSLDTCLVEKIAPLLALVEEIAFQHCADRPTTYKS